MSRESHIFNVGPFGPQETISDYECFGWEVLSINGNQIVMSRETQNPVFPDLVKAQAKYEETLVKYYTIVKNEPQFRSSYTPIKPSTCFVSFICFVIPCVIYVGYKLYKKKIYNEAYLAWQAEHEAWKKRKQDVLQELKKIALDSRANFFAKRDS